MRILMLSPDAQMIDRRILQEARSLQRAGHAVVVLSGFECTQPDAYVEPSGVVVKRYTYDWSDSRRERLQRRFGRFGTALWLCLKMLDKAMARAGGFEAFVVEKILEHEFDVLHVHDFPLLRAGCNAARGRGIPVIYDSHEFYPVQSCFTPKQQKRFLSLERRLVRYCKSVITVNPYIAKMIAKEHAISEPLVILNASPAVAQDSSDVHAVTKTTAQRDLRARYKLPADSFLFLYQGWISPERNIESLIRAMAEAPTPAALLIVGYGDHVAALQSLTRSLNLDHKVVFCGRVESDELHALTCACDVGIIPYVAVDEMHKYCSPNKLFEFVAAGLPIIATDLPYLRDVIGGYDIGWLCDTSDPRTLSEQMRAALSDEQQRNRFKANLAKAQKELNWEVEEQKLFRLYSNFAKNLTKDAA
jgi:glycosyltransferase involved in cell wall biosynthesis